MAGRGFRVRIRQGNTGAGRGQDFSDAPADAFGTAGDEGDLAVEVEELRD